MADRRWHFVYIPHGSWTHFDFHSDPDCHRLSITLGRFGFRWLA